MHKASLVYARYGIENTKKSPLFILFFIYNTDHIEFNNI